MTKTIRPKVELTVPRDWDDRRVGKDTELWKSVARVLDFHGLSTQQDVVAFVCLDCQSVGVCENRRARDVNVANFDFTCHVRTVTFSTEEV